MTSDLPLPAWLAQAQDDHPAHPAAVADGLMARAASLPMNADGAQALRLAEHVWLAHLADVAGLAAFRGRLAWASDSAPPVAQQALSRLDGALALLHGQPLPELDPATRWRAQQNVVLAWAAMGRSDEAQALLLADEAAAAALGASDGGRAYAASANNVALELQDGAGRDPARDRLMIVAAQLSLRAWGSAGTWLHLERAQYRLALCHAAAGQGGPALTHAQLCLQACAQGDGQQPADAVEFFFAQEALARAHLAAQDAAAAHQAVLQMTGLLAQIDEADGLRAWCAQALDALPKPGG